MAALGNGNRQSSTSRTYLQQEWTDYFYQQPCTGTSHRILRFPCQSLSYRMLLSYSRHWGTYDNPLNEIKKQFNSLFEVTYAPQQLKGWSFTVSGAMDRGSMLGNNYGGMLVIRKQGIIKSGNK